MNLDDAALEQRLRDSYAAVSETIDLPTPSVDFLPLERESDGMRRAPQAPRHRVRTVIAAFSAVLVVAVAVAVVAANDSSSDRARRPGGGPAATSSTSVRAPEVAPIFPTYPAHHGAPLLLAPTSIPDGFHLVVSTRGRGGIGGSGSPGGTVQYWVKLDVRAQRPLASFEVSWGPANLGEAAKNSGDPNFAGRYHGDALDGFRSQSVPTTVAGHAALYSAGLATFAWEQNNQLVTVSGAMDNWIGTWPEHLTRAELEDIAAHLVRDPDGRYTLTEVPRGFRLSAEEPAFASEGTNERELAYSDGANHGFAIQLVDDSQQPPGVKLANPPARLTTIRGQRAVVTPFLNGGPACTAADAFLCGDRPGQLSHLSVIWTEPDNTTVTVTSVGITQRQLLAIAHNLEPVQPSDWPQITNATP
jgi:hypothetical protein